MKVFNLFFFLTLSITGMSQIGEAYLDFQVKFYNRTQKENIKIEDCIATLIIDNDTIVTHPDSIYRMHYPIENMELIVKYKDLCIATKFDKSVTSHLYCFDEVFIDIYLHPANKTGCYSIRCSCDKINTLLWGYDSCLEKKDGRRNHLIIVSSSQDVTHLAIRKKYIE